MSLRSSLPLLVLAEAGCSLGSFDYLSADFGSAGGGSLGGSTAGFASGGGVSGGSGAATAGAAAVAGSGAAAGNGEAGGGPIAEWFCDPELAVFDAQAGAELPLSGDYHVVSNALKAGGCLVTPNWPELEDKNGYAIVQPDCGLPGSGFALQPNQVWHLEQLCSDVYRLTTLHDTAAERQLSTLSQVEDGTALLSVASTRSLDPRLLFRLRHEGSADAGHWRFSPVVAPTLCLEESGQTRYGQIDVLRVVLFSCLGNLTQQSWDLVPAP